MAYNKEILILAVIALIAVIGLILMIKLSSTGLGMYGGSLYPGRAVEKNAIERFVKGGTPEGVVVATEERSGYLQYMGLNECPENYMPISKSQYTSKLGYYKDICVPNLYPEYYPGIMCCPSRFNSR